VSEQFALLESLASAPEGLCYVADFVSSETEQKHALPAVVHRPQHADAA
jgi:hypothetical protein